ncbi:taste receptor type 1 member 1-like [Pyxicephalus adspersus]|uniref:taste receptor type 1 member 1-like n=1 Tax=Pyxicephalus adspersus TaxID=30357 RepID=UPI003B59ED81
MADTMRDQADDSSSPGRTESSVHSCTALDYTKLAMEVSKHLKPTLIQDIKEALQQHLQPITEIVTKHGEELQSMQQRISDLEDDLLSTPTQQQQMSEHYLQLKEKVIIMENRARSNNLWIIYVPESYKPCELEKLCSITFPKSLGLKAPMKIERAQRLGHPQPKAVLRGNIMAYVTSKKKQTLARYHEACSQARQAYLAFRSSLTVSDKEHSSSSPVQESCLLVTSCYESCDAMSALPFTPENQKHSICLQMCEHHLSCFCSCTPFDVTCLCVHGGQHLAVAHSITFTPLEALVQTRKLLRFATPRTSVPAELVPASRCNERCPPGYHKATKEGMHSCCYICLQCPQGQISNATDIEVCSRCPDEEWSDDKRVECIPKTYEFLSYEKDTLVLVFVILIVMFSVKSLFTLINFIYCWNTSIVKANNRTVSFILLTSILLSFLCVFLFLGRPVDITCILRQILFGIFFSIAVSSVLAKTITVCIAFKASKPGSYWRKWVGKKFPNYVVLLLSSVQVLICVIWLSVSPPYQEYDMDSYPGKIIIQCNEGSVIGFYSVLGYMGFLAAVSFVLAFMVRTLPDSFNEAKYITFSMLVFCSVWIAMIPAYLSTKGKYMVAVEVFAILASSAGILGCIFFPKLYFLLVKPYLISIKNNAYMKKKINN